MAKDPAFLFYPNDYIGGTMGMTFEEKGAYMEILMMQFNRGHMSEHMIRQTVGQLWDRFKDKFVQDEEGNYFNSRLQEEKEKRMKFTASRRNNKSGNNQYTKKPKKSLGHMTEHMENRNESIDIINSIKELDLEPIFMQLNISPDLMDPYRSEFISKLMLNDEIKTLPKAKTWLGNWLKLQPKVKLDYMPIEEQKRRGLNMERKYIYGDYDNENCGYSGLMTDKEKKDRGLDVNLIYSRTGNLIK